MKTVTVRLPEALAAEIEAEASARRIAKSDVIRERLEQAQRPPAGSSSLHDIADLIGSVEDDLPRDLSARKKEHLRTTGFGRDRAR